MGLPKQLTPMLAERAPEAFDSDEHLFEIKWDGIRALAFCEAGTLRLRNRRGIDITERYPELGALGGLPPGTVLDGELVLFTDGKPDFAGLMSREQSGARLKSRTGARARPTTFIAFDQLYRDFESVESRPLLERRRLLEESVAGLEFPRLVFSDGIVGAGCRLFEETCARELEGIVAKRLASPYRRGKRHSDWQKIKKGAEIVCVVIGYLLNEEGELRSLVLGAQIEGELRTVGKVGSGLSSHERRQFLDRSRGRERSEPVVPSGESATWLEPEIFVLVSYLEWTKGGELRSPVFERFLEP